MGAQRICRRPPEEQRCHVIRKEPAMRKVKIKKLTLSKETLRDLEKSELRRALGGNTVQLCTEGTFACSLCRTC
jgi:natural product precursor